MKKCEILLTLKKIGTSFSIYSNKIKGKIFSGKDDLNFLPCYITCCCLLVKDLSTLLMENNKSLKL